MVSLITVPNTSKECKLRTKLDAKQMQCVDGLRALAVLGVVIQHYKVVFTGPHGAIALLTTPGASGVMLFFVISGLCITLSKTERVSWKQFFVRRASRLLPALYASMLLILIANYVLLHRRLTTADFLGVAFVLPHYFSSLLVINAPLWSLQTEIELYLLFPATLYLFFRTSRRTFLTLSMVMTLTAFVTWYAATRSFTYFPPFPAFCHLVIWDLGLLIAYDIFPAAQHLPGGPASSRRPMLLLVQSCLVLIMSFTCLLLRNKALTNELAFWYLIAGYGYYLLTKWTLIAKPILLRIGAMQIIGKRSYSIYLVHLPIAVLCAQVIHAGPLAFVIAVSVTGIIVELIYRYIEMPFIALGKRLTVSGHGPVAAEESEKAAV